MLYCEKCGAEIEEDAKFCSKCGTPVAGYRREERRGPECFGWERGGQIWGTIAIGVFLIGLAILWYLDIFWPGIIFLIGIMIIIGGILPYIRGGRRRSSSPPK
ncbi:MAG: zinc-ribbon domain-containing protein [Candidatus Methylarchaceae archaeon HK02M1]|nr:zinc-ribbon domain-containing protein [Candidatus Methylarchaceae archaeon HK02M1]